jgi:transposase
MARARFIHPLAILWKETELKGIIAILFLCLLLDHRARASFDHRRRDDRAIFKEELSHP